MIEILFLGALAVAAVTAWHITSQDDQIQELREELFWANRTIRDLRNELREYYSNE